MSRTLSAGFLLAGLLAGFAAVAQQALSVEEQVRRNVDELRNMTPDGSKVAAHNAQMDAAWKYYRAHIDQALPVLREELALEMHKQARKDMVLLDIGDFLNKYGKAEDKALTRSALFAIDPSVQVIKWNQQQLFPLLFEAAMDRDPRTLSMSERAFLREDAKVFVPAHAMTLDSTLCSVFLFGVYGAGAEEYLRTRLADAKVANRIIEVLVWIGSSASNAAIRDVMSRNRNRETFVRATAYMMQVGGPEGRDIMLQVKPSDLDAASAEYYGKIRTDIESVDFPKMAALVSGIESDATIVDGNLMDRLTAIRSADGKGISGAARAIVESKLPGRQLIDQLTAIRASALRRVSDEALSDVKLISFLINALRYKEYAK